MSLTPAFIRASSVIRTGIEFAKRTGGEFDCEHPELLLTIQARYYDHSFSEAQEVQMFRMMMMYDIPHIKDQAYRVIGVLRDPDLLEGLSEVEATVLFDRFMKMESAPFHSPKLIPHTLARLGLLSEDQIMHYIQTLAIEDRWNELFDLTSGKPIPTTDSVSPILEQVVAILSGDRPNDRTKGEGVRAKRGGEGAMGEESFRGERNVLRSKLMTQAHRLCLCTKEELYATLSSNYLQDLVENESLPLKKSPFLQRVLRQEIPIFGRFHDQKFMKFPDKPIDPMFFDSFSLYYQKSVYEKMALFLEGFDIPLEMFVKNLSVIDFETFAKNSKDQKAFVSCRQYNRRTPLKTRVLRVEYFAKLGHRASLELAHSQLGHQELRDYLVDRFECYGLDPKSLNEAYGNLKPGKIGTWKMNEPRASSFEHSERMMSPSCCHGFTKYTRYRDCRAIDAVFEYFYQTDSSRRYHVGNCNNLSSRFARTYSPLAHALLIDFIFDYPNLKRSKHSMARRFWNWLLRDCVEVEYENAPENPEYQLDCKLERDFQRQREKAKENRKSIFSAGI